MLILLTCSFLCLFLVLLVNIASLLISENVVLSREELSAYECGFEHHNSSRLPFSLRYFFLTLLFLLFDLEIIFLLFIPSLVFSVSPSLVMLISFFFILVLFLSLIYEWNDGTLEWLS